jgi:predicted Rossmann fold flavoprotein
MKRISTLIIGGGAAGIVAAISARRKGDTVLICEKMPRLGKKILISGNGRCNLLNDDVSEGKYKNYAGKLVKSVFSKFGKDDIVSFFNKLGLEMYSKDSRVFPITNQASSVLRVLEMELARLTIPLELGFNAVGVSDSKYGFVVRSEAGAAIECQKVVIAGGGKSYPALGSDGSAYLLAGQSGHRIIEPAPSAVPLVIKDRLCHLLQGQRIFADAKSVIDGKVTSEASGEVLFTKYGLSGTSILDISEDISVAVNRHDKKDVFVSIDMVPFLNKEELRRELTKRVQGKVSPEDFFVGILPNKFGPALKDLVPGRRIDSMIEGLKDRRFKILGTRGWNEAEFTSGGVDAREVKEDTLESKLKKGLYFAGEVLDVGGERGGYHLAWAWASGFTAGLTG